MPHKKPKMFWSGPAQGSDAAEGSEAHGWSTDQGTQQANQMLATSGHFANLNCVSQSVAFNTSESSAHGIRRHDDMAQSTSGGSSDSLSQSDLHNISVKKFRLD